MPIGAVQVLEDLDDATIRPLLLAERTLLKNRDGLAQIEGRLGVAARTADREPPELVERDAEFFGQRP